MSAYKSCSSVSKPRVRQNHHKQGLNQTIEKLSADFRVSSNNRFRFLVIRFKVNLVDCLTGNSGDREVPIC